MTKTAESKPSEDTRLDEDGIETVTPEVIIPAGNGDADEDNSQEPQQPMRPMKASTMAKVDVPLDMEKYINPKPYILLGTLVALLLFGSFTAWSVFAPLAKGTVAPGVISVESNRKAIQHLEGGIIRALMIKNGDKVKAGDVLLEIESARASANLEIVRARRLAATARLARLQAQRDGMKGVTFPAEVQESAVRSPETAAIVNAELAAFDSQRETLENRRRIFVEQSGQLEDQIKGFEAQITSYEEQLRLIGEEIEDVTFLHEKGLIERTRLRSLQRTSASLTGEIEANRARIAQARQRISESDLQVIDLDNAYREQVVAELRKVRENLTDLGDELSAAGDVVRRLEITAPQSGTIVNLTFHTIGGVVRPGETIAELVPENDKLIVTAQLSPMVIDSVHVGLPSQVVLSAFNRRKVPHMAGHVIQVSADRITDPRSGVPYYEALVQIDDGELDKVKGLELYPGMPAEVVIVTGERSALEYFIGPLAQSARRGFISE